MQLFFKKENEMQVTFAGNPLTLVGAPQRQVGDPAPDFTVVANDLSEKHLTDFKEKVLILSVVPSLDTPVCDAQTRRFNEEAAKLPNVKILTISADLPFAQARWCGAAGIDAVETLSDHRETSFGLAYGLLVKELRLLARAVLVLDHARNIVYQEIVPEMTNEVNFTAALEAAKSVA